MRSVGRLLAAVALLLATLGVHAAAPVAAGGELPVPRLTGHVIDQAGTLAATDAKALEAKVSETPEVDEARKAAETSASSQISQAPNAPKVVRRVVCSYKLGWLPGE